MFTHLIVVFNPTVLHCRCGHLKNQSYETAKRKHYARSRVDKCVQSSAKSVMLTLSWSGFSNIFVLCLSLCKNRFWLLLAAEVTWTNSHKRFENCFELDALTDATWAQSSNLRIARLATEHWATAAPVEKWTDNVISVYFNNKIRQNYVFWLVSKLVICDLLKSPLKIIQQ